MCFALFCSHNGHFNRNCPAEYEALQHTHVSAQGTASQHVSTQGDRRKRCVLLDHTVKGQEALGMDVHTE